MLSKMLSFRNQMAPKEVTHNESALPTSVITSARTARNQVVKLCSVLDLKANLCHVPLDLRVNQPSSLQFGAINSLHPCSQSRN